jgi:hypothetical protein
MNLNKQSACHVASKYAVTRAGGSAIASMNVTNARMRIARRRCASALLLPGVHEAHEGRQRPWTVTRETCENGAIRSSWFEVPRPSNFGPRTLASHSSRLSRPSCTAILRGWSVLVPDVQAIEVLLCRNGFPSAC